MRRTCKISYISWVAGSISPLVVFAQVTMFVIAQASKFKSYLENQNSLDTLCMTIVRIEKRKCSCWKAVEIFSWVELFELSWTSSAELSFFSWAELLQLSWAFSAELNFFSWVELFQLSWTSTSTLKLSNQNQLNLPPGQLIWGFSPKLSGQNRLNWSPGAVQPVTGTSAKSDL
jgi:hypothetical protein